MTLQPSGKNLELCEQSNRRPDPTRTYHILNISRIDVNAKDDTKEKTALIWASEKGCLTATSNIHSIHLPFPLAVNDGKPSSP